MVDIEKVIEVMFLNAHHKAVFVPIARVASGSIAQALKQGRVNVKADQIRKVIGEFEWDRRFKFTFVRDPYDRFLSAINSHAFATGDKDEEIMNFAEGAMVRNPSIFMKQSDYINEELDFIGKYENLEEDWNKVCEALGTEIKLDKSNKTEIIYKELTPRARDFVTGYYTEDFKRFKYGRK